MIFRSFVFTLLISTAALASDLKISIQSPTGDRVAGVQVSLFRNSDNGGAGTQVTAGDGIATFAQVSDGAYHAIILAPGFAEQSLPVTFPQSGVISVQLKLTATPQTVVVSASATPEIAERTGVSIDLLNSEQLTTINPVAASDALHYLPGAIVSSTGRRGNLASLFVRGGESNYNKVLIDGVPVNDPGGTFDFGVVPMNNVERLEFVRGPESTIYGSDAMTSVVQLGPRPAARIRRRWNSERMGGTFSTAHGYASIAGARGRYDFNVFGDQFNTEGQGIQRRVFQFAARRQYRHSPVEPRVITYRIRHYNSYTGVQNNWWFNGSPEIPPDPNQYARQNNFLASAALTISGTGAWQHSITGFEYNHAAQNVNPVNDPARPFDSPSIAWQSTTWPGLRIRAPTRHAPGRRPRLATPSKTRTAISTTTRPVA